MQWIWSLAAMYLQQEQAIGIVDDEVDLSNSRRERLSHGTADVGSQGKVKVKEIHERHEPGCSGQLHTVCL